MVSIEINNLRFNTNSSLSILEASEFFGFFIPRFCYHKTLSVAGNCRMCLVEVEKIMKPIAACFYPLQENIKIFTETPFVKKARENILELLLINHPLDCPICDQGGECDLQDQSKEFGVDITRYFLSKRTVTDKYCNSKVKMIMTRCIHCTRCVRFNNEISGFPFLGVLGRGSKMEIGSYVRSIYASPLSGNLIDLCPVGALTGKISSGQYRSWELKLVESVDTFDGIGSRIYINSKENDTIRILPIYDLEKNQTRITDETRFAVDSFKKSLVNQEQKTYKEKHHFLVSNKKTLLFTNTFLDMDFLSFQQKKETFAHTCFKKIEKTKNTKLFFKHSSLTPTLNKANFLISWTNGTLAEFNHNTQKLCVNFTDSLESKAPLIESTLKVKSQMKNINLYHFGKSNDKSYIKTYSKFNNKKIYETLSGVETIVQIQINDEEKHIILTEEKTTIQGLPNELLNSTFLKLVPTNFSLTLYLSPNKLGSKLLGESCVSSRQFKLFNYFFEAKNNCALYIIKKNYIENVNNKKFFALNTKHKNVFYVNVEQRAQKAITLPFQNPTVNSANSNITTKFKYQIVT